MYLIRNEYDRAIADFDQAIKFDGQSAESFTYRGLARYFTNQISDSKSDFERALELDALNLDAANSLAWILATDPDDDFRDGNRALELADSACERCGYAIWNYVGTLAAAHAEVGDFEQARNFAEESLRLAPADEHEGCKNRLQSYEDNQPWREFVKPGLRELN